MSHRLQPLNIEKQKASVVLDLLSLPLYNVLYQFLFQVGCVIDQTWLIDKLVVLKLFLFFFFMQSHEEWPFIFSWIRDKDDLMFVIRGGNKKIRYWLIN